MSVLLRFRTEYDICVGFPVASSRRITYISVGKTTDTQDASHFLLSAKARTLSLVAVLRLSDRDAETMFASIRWTETDGKAACPHCGCPTCYEARRPNGALRFRCKACCKDFSLTSGTLFAFHKLPLQTYLAAIVIFCNEVKGKSALALSRDLDVQYKTAWAMATEMKGFRLGGEGKVVEVDGGYFGGYIKPSNHKENRRDRRLLRNQNGKRQCVVVIRQRDGRTMPNAFSSEGAATAFIRNHVAEGTEIMTNEAGSWNALHGRYVVKTINHQLAYSDNGACTNGAESFFSRMRRAEQGHHHHIAAAYLARYAQERVARGSSLGRQRRPGSWRSPAGAAGANERRFLWVLAAGGGLVIRSRRDRRL